MDSFISTKRHTYSRTFFLSSPLHLCILRLFSSICEIWHHFYFAINDLRMNSLICHLLGAFRIETQWLMPLSQNHSRFSPEKKIRLEKNEKFTASFVSISTFSRLLLAMTGEDIQQSKISFFRPSSLDNQFQWTEKEKRIIQIEANVSTWLKNLFISFCSFFLCWLV